MIYASTPATGSARHKGPGRYLAAGVGYGRVHEPNPLLILWRETTDGDMRGWGTWLTLAAYDMIYDGLCTEAHKEHARRVLRRLARAQDALA